MKGLRFWRLGIIFHKPFRYSGLRLGQFALTLKLWGVCFYFKLVWDRELNVQIALLRATKIGRRPIRTQPFDMFGDL